MSSARSSSATGSAWLRLLDERFATLREHKINVSAVITSEDLFRDHFEEFGRRLREPRYTALLVKLRCFWIIQWASQVDRVEQHPSTYNLVALIWTSIYAAIETSIDANENLARENLAGVVEIIGNLNSAVPRVQTNFDHFPLDNALQEALHHIIDKYTDTLLSVVLCIKSARAARTGIRADYIGGLLKGAAVEFAQQGELLTRAIERASSLEAQNASSDSSSYGTLATNDHTAHFEVLEPLGRGSEGDVHKVRESTTRQIYARKQILVRGSSSRGSRTVEQVQNEVAIMRSLKHMHIVSVSFWTKSSLSCSIFLEPCADCNLRAYLEHCVEEKYPNKLLEPIIPWFGCLLTALALAHNQRIAHQDIKPSNILVKDGQIFLTDFGEAKDFTGYETNRTRNDEVCGTPVYRAPEVRPGVPRGFPADIFALGCVFSEMMTVLAKRSLEDYQDFRESDSSENSVAFRANLDKVRSWYEGLVLDDYKLYDVLEYMLKRMITNDPENRRTPQMLWDWLLKDESHNRYHCRSH
ncbi:hypothetical protein B0A55_05982 [Friedmanniomyces simplex]|uniref:Protein kinase domain-containing protein n=1 Tax=Friedmanniomyces simplex TaxID=329884 RepID=A0A4U0XA09_9PEZI|nr:hypothetical protein B0A55_05982 [Friedmanniomyces simplex]